MVPWLLQSLAIQISGQPLSTFSNTIQLCPPYNGCWALQFRNNHRNRAIVQNVIKLYTIVRRRSLHFTAIILSFKSIMYEEASIQRYL